MSQIESPQPPEVHLLQRGPDIAELVDSTISGALAALQREARAKWGSPLRRQCLAAVERLWQRRAAVVRALALPPQHAAPGGSRLDIEPATLPVEQAVELDMALANSTRILSDAAEGEWRELRLAARQRAGDGASAQTPWPPAPDACAAAFGWVVARTSDEHAVRLELMRLGTQLLVPHFVALCRRHLAGQPQAARPAEPVPASPAAAASPVAALLESAQPGQWFRMVLHDQWTPARLTWRSDNGRFFMFSSRLAGRSHSLSRSALERMIAGGQIEPLARGQADGDGDGAAYSFSGATKR
jgi:hypothetical protein